MDNQELIVAKWVHFGAGITKMPGAERSIEDLWKGFTADQKLNLTEMFAKHRDWFKENT